MLAPTQFKFKGKIVEEMSRADLLEAMDAFAELYAYYCYDEFCRYKNGKMQGLATKEQS